MSYKNLNYSSFGKLLGYSDVAISKIITGKNKPKFDLLNSILTKIPEINPEWLLTGKGEMLRGGSGYEVVPLTNDKVPEPVKEMQSIPVYDLRAAAGLSLLFGDQARQVPVEYIRIPYIKKADGAIFVTGDSMYPIIKSGDIVIFRKLNNIRDGYIWGEIYILDIALDGDEFLAVKYVQKSDKEGYIKLVSHNEHHHEKEIPVSAVRHAARVLASIRFHTLV